MIILLFACLFLLATLTAMIAYKLKNLSIIDISWALGPLLVTFLFYILYGETFSQLLFSILLSLWSLRLIFFLFFTRFLKGFKDKRYTQIQQKWSSSSFFYTLRHFYFQLCFQSVLCLPSLLVYLKTFDIKPLYYIGISSLFFLSLGLQHLSDYQLYCFKQSKQEGICRIGLWNYSRHPNYFFEFLIWLTLTILAYLICKIIYVFLTPLIVFIILRVMTGPYTERLSVNKHGDTYIKYQKEVPMFFLNIYQLLKGKK